MESLEPKQSGKVEELMKSEPRGEEFYTYQSVPGPVASLSGGSVDFQAPPVLEGARLINNTCLVVLHWLWTSECSAGLACIASGPEELVIRPSRTACGLSVLRDLKYIENAIVRA